MAVERGQHDYWMRRAFEEAGLALSTKEPCRAAAHRALSVLCAKRAEELLEAELSEARSLFFETALVSPETARVEAMVAIGPTDAPALQ